MINDSLLSPARLDAVAIFIVAVSVLMVAVHTSILAVAARRTTLAPRTQFLAPLLAGVVLAGWLGWAVLAVSERVLTPEPLSAPGQVVANPALLIEMAAFVTLGVVALFASKTVSLLNAATPPSGLIGLQSIVWRA